MSKQTLRGLAKGFAQGSIRKEEYRKSRAALIQGIIAGDIAVKDIDYEPPLMPNNGREEAITEGIKRDKAEAAPPQKKASKPIPSSATPVQQSVNDNKSNKNSSFIFILISAIIVLSMILAVILFYPKPPESSVPVSANDVSSGTTPESSNKEAITTSASMAGETMIADFLKEKTWNKDNLDKFIESWSALTEEERDAAKQTKRMQRMNDSIYKQFLKGKALSSIDSEKALLKQQELIEFAETLGINDSRLVLD
jgi:hypothetical protein